MSYLRCKSINVRYMASGMVAKVHGKNRRDDRQMLKQIQDVIKFILIYAGVCASEETEVWWNVCVWGGGRLGERQTERE